MGSWSLSLNFAHLNRNSSSYTRNASRSDRTGKEWSVHTKGKAPNGGVTSDRGGLSRDHQGVIIMENVLEGSKRL